MKNLTNQQKGSLMAFVAVMFITPDSLFIRLSNIDTWGLVFYRGLIPFLTVFIIMLIIYRSDFFKMLFTSGPQGLIYITTFSVTNVAFVVSIQNTNVANTLVMVAMAPMLSAILGAFFLKEIPSYKKLIIYVTPGLVLTALSLSFFLFSSLDTYSYDRNLFNIYMDKWDGHRAKTGDIHFEYIFKTIIVLLVINFFLENKKKYKFIIYFLNSLIISSILIYFIFKFSNLNSVGVFSSIIPGRFMATYTFISWPLVLSLIFEKFKKYNYINNLFYLLIIIYSIMHNKNFIQAKNNLSNLEILSVNKNQNKIFRELRDFEDTKNIIATENATFNTLYISKKPVLLSRSFDFLPYHRYLVNDIKEILEEVYGYNFNNPPIKNYPYLNYKYIKDNFEKRSKKDWIKIKNKFKSNYVITPNNWKLNLELISKDKNFKIYKII